jgi:hypothetical protein
MQNQGCCEDVEDGRFLDKQVGPVEAVDISWPDQKSTAFIG